MPAITKNISPSLHSWVEAVVSGIRPLRMEDYYREQLQEKARNLYETYLKDLRDPVQAEARTIEALGDQGEVRRQIEAEVRKESEQQKSELWKVPMVISGIFFIVFCVSVVACVLIAVRPDGWNQFLTDVFGRAGFLSGGTTEIFVYGNLIGSSLVWAVLSVLFMAVFGILAYRLKKR